MTTKPKVSVQQDVSRYGVNVYENGYRVLGTWAMTGAKALELYTKLGPNRKLNDRKEFRC
jgi:hypothetical protein